MAAPSTTPPAAAPDPGPLLELPPELRPSVEHLVTEDDTPVDNIYSEKQQRLLTRPLYSSWSGPEGKSFLALANVGMFYAIQKPPLVPDVLLSVGVPPPTDLHQKRQRSYFFWEIGRPPDVLIEVVSNLEGEELGRKKDLCAQIGIRIYVVWDPFRLLSADRLQVFGLHIDTYERIAPSWFPHLGLGLALWRGSFEGVADEWLRWADQAGQVIPLGEERAVAEHARAEQEHQRAEEQRQRAEQEHQRAEEQRQRAEQEHQRAEEQRQRAEQEHQRAEEQRQRAEQEHQRAEQAEARAAALLAQLRQRGAEPKSGE